jgi:hypothetical protein
MRLLSVFLLAIAVTPTSAQEIYRTEDPVPVETVDTAPLRYTVLRIVQPAPEATLRDNGGDVTVTMVPTPRLQRRFEHRLRLILDGVMLPVSSARSTLTLQNLNRGTHVLVAVIVDAGQVEIIRSQPVKFYLHRRSLRHPNQTKKPEKPDKKS